MKKILPILILLSLLTSCCSVRSLPVTKDPGEIETETETEAETESEIETEAETEAPVRFPALSLYSMYPRKLLDLVYSCQRGEICEIPEEYSENDIYTATLLVCADWYKTVGGIVHCDNADGTVSIYFDSELCGIDLDSDSVFAQSFAIGLNSDIAGLKQILPRIKERIVYDAEAASLESARLNGTANCLGMAFIFQRAALSMGFTSEIVLGYDMGFHAWNVVHTEDGYFYADPAFYCATGNEFYNINPQNLHTVTFGINKFWDNELPPSAVWNWSNPFENNEK